MKNLQSVSVLVGLSLLFSAPAFAGAAQVSGKDAGGTTREFDVTTDGSGNYVPWEVVCDYSAAANCQSVDSSHGALVAGEGTAGSAAGGVLTVQGVASMTPVLTNPGTIATWGLVAIGGASNPTNAAVAGCTYNSSVPTLSSGQSSGLQCNSSGELIVGNTNANGSATSANSSPVVIASDQAAVAIKAASASIASGAIASGAVASGAFASGSIASGAIASGAFASGSFLNATAGDACMFQAKTNAAFSSASGTFSIVAGVSSKKIYVCSISLIIPSAVSVSLAEGSSSTCGTSNQAAVIGVATSGTAANGMALPANGGFTLGNGGGTVAQTATAADYLCIFQSGTAQIAGNVTYVQQ